MKHFVDTSIARPLLLGTREYKRYFRSVLGAEPLYASTYVQMELERSYLLNVISFYFTLLLPTMHTLDDAIRLWTNQYAGSKLKAVLQLVAELAATHRLESNAKGKAQCLQVLSLYIKRIDLKIRRTFLDPSNDSTRCGRATVKLKVDSANPADGLRRFVDQFGDVDACRGRCRIDYTLLKRHRTSVERYVQIAHGLAENEETRGFLRITDTLRDILDRGGSACSCRTCEKVGDAVVALETPRMMNLEHTDRSFNHLCPPIEQPHSQHPSETAVVSST